MADMRVSLSGWQLDNPVIAASGTFGFGYEMAQWYDINLLGSISLKGTTAEARFGNPTPRIAECSAGLLNAIGLQNPGMDTVVKEELPRLREVFSKQAIANVCGFSVEEYVRVAQAFDACNEIALLEINISCPNVRHGGMAFGTSPAAAASVTEAVKRAVKKPVYIKLSPNVTDITEIAAAAESAGADGLVLINTLLGMRIDPRTGKKLISTGAAGFSGPAVKPVALRMVYQVCERVSVPVVGVGGICSGDDVLEFISAGAQAVEVGSCTLTDPFACKRIIEELEQRMEQWGISSLDEIRGRSHA